MLLIQASVSGGKCLAIEMRNIGYLLFSVIELIVNGLVQNIALEASAS
jgi:hypothetical protein